MSDYKERAQMRKTNVGSFSMSLEWAARHAQGARTDSKTLPLAAFPTLPLDGTPPVIPTPQVRKDSAFDLTDSKENMDTSPPTHGENFEAAEKAFDDDNWSENAHSKDLAEDTHLAAKQDVDTVTAPPTPKPSTKKRPRSVNYETLQAEHMALTNKRRMLEFQLRRLGHDIPRPVSSSTGSTSHTGSTICTADWTQTPTSVDALWLAIQKLRTINYKLEVQECRIRHTTGAEKKPPTRVPAYQKHLAVIVESFEVISSFRTGVGDDMLPVMEWEADANGNGDDGEDADVQAMRSTARRYALHPASTTSTTTATASFISTTSGNLQRSALAKADQPHAPSIPTHATATATGRPSDVFKRRKANHLVRWVPTVDPSSLVSTAVTRSVRVGLPGAGDERKASGELAERDSSAASNQH